MNVIYLILFNRNRYRKSVNPSVAKARSCLPNLHVVVRNCILGFARQLPKVAATLLILLFSVATNAGAAAEAPVQQFKRFIEETPPISNLLLVKELQGSISHTRIKFQPPSVYVGWGTGAIPSGDNPSITNYVNWIGRHENIYLLKSHNAFFTWTNHGDPAELGNTVHSTYEHMLGLQLSEALNMGMQVPPVGSIRWNDDSFVVTNADRGFIVRGKLSTNAKGQAERMVLRSIPLSKPNSDGFDSEYLYEYDSPLSLSYIPSTITVKSEVQGTPYTYKYRILKLELASRPLVASDFLVAPGDEDKLTRVTITNKYRLYTKRISGDTNLVAALDRQHRTPAKMATKTLFWVWAIAILSIFPIFLCLSHRKNKNNNNNIQIKDT